MVGFADQRLIALLIVVLGVVALIGVSMANAAFNTTDPIPGQVRFVGVDTNSSGNTFSSVSSYQISNSVFPGTPFTVDIVADEIDPADGLAGVEGALVYDNSKFRVVGIDPGSMVFVTPESPSDQFRFNDPLPDSSGHFNFSLADLDETAAETGEGVLARITMECVETGVSSLILEDGFFPGTQLSVYSEATRNNPGGIEPLPIVTQDTSYLGCGTTPTPSPGPTCTPAPGDPDCDGIQDPFDNCPTVSNNGQQDGDGDGDGNACDNCPNWSNSSQALPSWPVPVGDADCDGFPGTVAASSKAPETYIGTDPARHCPTTTTSNDEAVDAMPPDLNDDRAINGQDSGKFGGPYGSSGRLVSQGPFGPPGLQIPGVRFDFNGDGVINGQDIGKYQFYHNKMCVVSGP